MVIVAAKKGLIICGIALLLSVLLEIMLVEHHVSYWWHGIIGFDIVYGFAGCIAIVFISKFLGKAFIQRKENYYDGGEDNHD